MFANLEALYESLSPSLRGYLDTLQAIHVRDDAAVGRPPGPRFDGREPGPFAALHPLVRVHPETGKKHLFLATGFTKAIAGLRARESAAPARLPQRRTGRPRRPARPYPLEPWRPRGLGQPRRRPRRPDRRQVHRRRADRAPHHRRRRPAAGPRRLRLALPARGAVQHHQLAAHLAVMAGLTPGRDRGASPRQGTA
ncbi:MAG: TauD/TfdA family dioxygenase [Caulobacteraceae bacterium]